MQAYDAIFLALLVISCVFGVIRGATRELVNLISFFLSLFIAIACKGLLVKTFHLDTITGYIAVVLLYLLIYFLIRYFGHMLADRIQKQEALNVFDRVLGVGIGIFRTLVVLGVFHLILSAIMPIERQPHWFRGAMIYPLSAKCAKLIQAFIPATTGTASQVAEQTK